MFIAERIIEKVKKHGTCFVSVVGGGGKTETIYQLSKKLKDSYPVLITTSTAMFRPPLIYAQEVFVCEAGPNGVPDHRTYAWYSAEDDVVGDKLRGIKPEDLCHWHLGHREVCVLCEADGSKQLPIKAYSGHEPQIPSCTDIVIIVIGLDALYKPLDQGFVHRPEILSKITETEIGALITPQSLTKLMHHPDGMLKDIPESAEIILLLNKCECLEGVFHVNHFFQTLPERVHSLVVANMAKAEEIAVFRRPT